MGQSKPLDAQASIDAPETLAEIERHAALLALVSRARHHDLLAYFFDMARIEAANLRQASTPVVDGVAHVIGDGASRRNGGRP